LSLAEHGIGWLNRPGTIGQSWNPVRGCSRVSEGCRHCYAERIAARFSGPGKVFEGFARRVAGTPRWTGKVELIPEKLAEPLRWRSPRTVFVNSMSDLFHERLSDLAIASVFGVMAAAREHTFLILTKRPERAAEWFQWAAGYPAGTPDCLCQREAYKLGVKIPLHGVKGTLKCYPWPLLNVLVGTSVEDQPTADERIPHLLRCPVAGRFVSYEPALAGPVDFGFQSATCSCCPRWPSRWVFLPRPVRGDFHWSNIEAAAGFHRAESNPHGALSIRTEHGLLGVKPAEFGCLPRLDWIIVGGESGPGARPFDLAWARSTVEQCRAAGVPVFVKQVGARPCHGEGEGFPHAPGDVAKPRTVGDGEGRYFVTLRDRKGGDWNEWPEDLRVREFPETT